MERLSCLILILTIVCCDGAMIRQRRIIGGHDVKKRSIDSSNFFEVISTIDDHNPDYPAAHAERTLNELERYNLTIYFSNANDTKTYGIDDKVQNYTNLCNHKSVSISVYPTVIKDDHGKTYNILNSKARPTQLLSYEICLTQNTTQNPLYPESSDTFETCQFTHTTRNNRAAKCTQQYVYRNYYVISDTDRNKIEVKVIKTPSCCSCYAYRTSE